MSLASVIGQEAAVAALQSALAREEVPQSYLFLGPDSVGKAATALEFAKAVCCKNRAPGGTDACDTCVNCTRIAADQHPDVARIVPDGEFTRVWQLWSRPGHPPGALETINFAPVAAPRRFYLLERAEKPWNFDLGPVSGSAVALCTMPLAPAPSRSVAITAFGFISA